MSKLPLTTLILLTTLLAHCAKPRVLEPYAQHVLAPAILEPSDVCIHPNGRSLLIVSDKGYLYHTDTLGEVLETAAFRGVDFEGVWADDSLIYVVDERESVVHRFSIDGLNLLSTVSVPHGGKPNSGFESITYNHVRGVFVMVTEKKPINIHELNSDFEIQRVIPFTQTRDISAATWHNDYLWLLSDEDRVVLKLNPLTYRVLERWSIPTVIKPEGIVFWNDSTMLIVCDKEHILSYVHLLLVTFL